MVAAYSFNSLVALLLLLVLFISRVVSKDDGNQSVLSKLLSGYDKEIRPCEGVKPLRVYADAIVDSIGVIEEASMQYTVYLYFHQYWTDERLAGKVNKSVTLTGLAISHFWKPDPYCYNARISNLMAEDKDVRSRLTVGPDGSMFYSRRAIVTASCFMDLRDFPLDSQVCYLRFGSYSQGDGKIRFFWKEDKISVLSKRLAQFYLDSVSLTTLTESYVGENFTTIKIEFTLNRRVGYYIIQAYCPDILIVVLSWIILWMDSRDMGDRMALGITTILTIMFLLGATNASMPKVSYPKALDWYLLVSFAFVFMTLVESMLVFLLTNKSENKKPAKPHRRSLSPYQRVSILFRSKPPKKASLHNRSQSPNITLDKMHNFIENDVQPEAEMPVKDSDGFLENHDAERVSFRGQRSSHCGEKVDRISRILFPLAFLVFNVSYWYTYLYSS